MAAEPTNGGNMIVLISADGKRFEVTEAAASQSLLVCGMIEDGCTANGIPLPNVVADILAKVVEYCNKHAAVSSEAAGSSSSSEELMKFDAKFVDVDKATLLELILAANYMNIKGLVDLTCQRVADMMSGKTPEQMREMFGFENDFTPEEEEAIRKENAWAFGN
ncbi:hypothetical protein E2562_000134 [Oryza meyeriana var. granulata]|uniref:SKP1-like protein n=1 Tax=Oryza meyeriana var. granulata TaxID=110450 RepID=A0A6G1DAM5_9ORYZ|nr:hypothetical protein E2562_000134 [Oryza meyeriana var. granulata]